MSLKIISREELDIEKWNALVNSDQEHAPTNFTWYLDEIAENWEAVVNDDYTQGMALPYTLRLGKKILYTPIFTTAVEFMGTFSGDLVDLIGDRYQSLEFAVKQDVFGSPDENYVYQIAPSERKLGSQGKRHLNKAKKSGFEVIETTEFNRVFELVSNELNGKFTGINDRTLERLNRALINGESEKSLLCFELMHEANFVGGIICLRTKGQLFYLKGTTTEDSKKLGGMYLLLNTAVNYACEKGMNFDFGGSRVPGVQKFNLNLGGEDVNYAYYLKEGGPGWFKALRKIKKSIR